MEQVRVKVDSRGRICAPAEIREITGDTLLSKKTSRCYLLLSGKGKQQDFLEEFKRLITSEQKRIGKPKLASLKEMKEGRRIVK